LNKQERKEGGKKAPHQGKKKETGEKKRLKRGGGLVDFTRTGVRTFGRTGHKRPGWNQEGGDREERSKQRGEGRGKTKKAKKGPRYSPGDSVEYV